MSKDEDEPEGRGNGAENGEEIPWDKLRLKVIAGEKESSMEGAQQAMSAMMEHLAQQIDFYGQKREQYEEMIQGLERRESEVVSRESKLESRESDLEQQILERAREVSRQDITTYYKAMTDVMLSGATDTAKRTAIYQLMRKRGVSEEESVGYLLGIWKDKDLHEYLRLLGEEVEENIKDFQVLIAASEAAGRVQEELEERERKLDERISEAEDMEREVIQREQGLIETALFLEDTRVKLVEDAGRVRSIYNFLDTLAETVRQTMYPDFKRYRARIDDIQRAYTVKSAALLLNRNFLEQLEAETGDITAGLSDDNKAALKRIVIKDGIPEQQAFGKEDGLGQYFIAPISTENGTVLAHFCLAGLPVNGGQVTEEYRSRLTEVADSMRRTLKRDYAVIFALSQKGKLGYILPRLEAIEQDLRTRTKG